MKLKSIILLSISIYLLIFMNQLQAQNDLFTGRLIDSETRKPIANAKINLVGEEDSTYSNILGYFQISGAGKSIKVSHIGYKTATTELKENTPKFLMQLPPKKYILKALHLEELVEVSQESLSYTEEKTENSYENKPQPDQIATFPGGLKAFHIYINNSLYKNRDTLVVPFDFKVLFTINESGELKVDSILGEIQKSNVIRSIFENSPKWNPALQSGLGVHTSFEQELSLHTVEQAEPIDGIQAFYNYIMEKQATRYPVEAQRMGVEGVVYVQMDIEKDGSVTNVFAAKGIGAGCDEVAVELVKNGPKWKAATQDGEAVRSQRVIPLRFVLN
ncbi:TonB family protein [Marivirga salinae]|uniref:TonB family protein n=1 Tax=Marivirga salinarum TaxID=3059078 RepID=A0AA49GCW9_9BACT|nr:TonB family protein [Marivirga sp. BDSF4-3]WKK78203.2 TonB family protein [Marivirga sp. BDSF4-3]